MTIEEAINRVQGYLTDYLPIEDSDELEEITKALKQEPYEDAISRKSMLNYQQYLHDWMSNEANHKLWESFKDFLSVTPTQKKGKWVKMAVTNGRGRHECNICHTYAPSYQNGDEYLSEFCPHCGSSMNEEEDA